jgi:hypothetical protein
MMRRALTPPLRVALVAAAAALAGCAVTPAGPSVLVLPGTQKSPAQFQADNADCQQQATAQVEPQVQAANNQAAATAVVGTAIGAAVGALFGYGGYGGYGGYSSQSAAWGAGTGLAFGSAMGSSGSQAANYGVQQRYDMAFVQCMVLRGNQLPAQAGAKRIWQTPPPPPPPPQQMPPSYPPPNTPPPIGSPPAG